jgi:Glycosyltransferase family 87
VGANRRRNAASLGEHHGDALRRALWQLLVVSSAILLIAASAKLLLQGTVYADQVDLQTYVAGTRRLFGDAALYPAWETGQPFPFWTAAGGDGYVYPPTGAFVLAPLALGSALWVPWNAGGIVAYILVGLLIVRREAPSWRGPGAMIITLAVLTLHPGLQAVRSGEASSWVAAAYGSMWLAPRAAGWLATLTGLVKATPGLGILWAIRNRQPVLTPLALGVTLAAVTFIMSPANWLDWLRALHNGYAVCGQWWSLPSLGCAGLSWIGWVAAAGLGILAMRVSRDSVAFALLAFGIVLLPAEMFWGYLLIPFLGILPLACQVMGASRLHLRPLPTR